MKYYLNWETLIVLLQLQNITVYITPFLEAVHLKSWTRNILKDGSLLLKFRETMAVQPNSHSRCWKRRKCFYSPKKNCSTKQWKSLWFRLTWRIVNYLCPAKGCHPWIKLFGLGTTTYRNKSYSIPHECCKSDIQLIFWLKSHFNNNSFLHFKKNGLCTPSPRLACLTPWASGEPRRGLGSCTFCDEGSSS